MAKTEKKTGEPTEEEFDSYETATPATDQPTPKQDSRFRIQDIVFAFGPNNSYFISTTRSSYYYHGSPKTCSIFDANKISRPIAIALTSDTGFIFVFDDDEYEGRASVQRATPDHRVEIMTDEAGVEQWLENRKQLNRLYDFLREDEDSEVRREVAFSIGPGEASWFARRGTETHWYGLPKALRLDIEAKGQSPLQVTLGTYGSCVALWTNGGLTWELRGYDGLHEQLDDLSSGTLPNIIVLSPYNSNEWFMVLDTGLVTWRLQGDVQKTGKIAKLARGYMQREARRRGVRFSVSGTDGESDIGPETEFDGDEDERGRWERLRGWVKGRLEGMETTGILNRKNMIIAAATGCVLAGVITWQVRKQTFAGRNLLPSNRLMPRAIVARSLVFAGLAGALVAISYGLGRRSARREIEHQH